MGKVINFDVAQALINYVARNKNEYILDNETCKMVANANKKLKYLRVLLKEGPHK